MAKTFEEYIKSQPTFTADRARSLAQAAYEQQRIDEYEQLISTQYFQEIIGKIKIAAEAGESSIIILPAETEEIEVYTKAHKLVPESMLAFTEEQCDVLSGLKSIGYVTQVNTTQGYLDGMNPNDHPLSVQQCTVYWGRN